MPNPEYYRGQPLSLSGDVQLLIDDTFVEDRYNLQRVLHHPIKYERNPILLRDQPWEGDAAFSPLVIWDPHMGRYRMWYQCWDVNSYYSVSESPYYVGYAESDDGLNWTKPHLDGCAFGGYEKTNIVYSGNAKNNTGKQSFALGQVWLDEDADPSERYKIIGLDRRPHPRHPQTFINSEISIIGSPDGIHWKLLGDGPIYDHHSDTANHLVYDSQRKHWLLYCRPVVTAAGSEYKDGRSHSRRVCVMISEDLQTWSYPRIILFGDERDLVDIDHCRVFRYGSHFLMLYAAMAGDDLGRFHTRLASSTDGIHWERFHTREDFVPMGNEGAWDAGIIGPASGPVRQGDMLLFYYLGANVGQCEPFVARQMRRMGGGAFMMKPDRFISQRAEGNTGYLLTREFVLDGSSLTLNGQTDGRPPSSAGGGGRIRVEVLKHPPLGYHLDEHLARGGHIHAYEGFSLDDCVPFAGDRINAPIRWNGGDLKSLQGKPVYLRFELTNADLFAFRILK